VSLFGVDMMFALTIHYCQIARFVVDIYALRVVEVDAEKARKHPN